MLNMSQYPRVFWVISGLSVFIACGTLFIPFPFIENTLGISFSVFFIVASLVEFVCAGAIIYMLMKYRAPREERESEWKYNP